MPLDRNNFDHYVAQHYIKRFANDAGLVYVGNIANGSVSELSDVSRILGRRNWSVDQLVEDVFTSVETPVAGALRTIAGNPDAIRGLSEQTRIGLHNFIILHHSRAPGVHDAMNQSTQQFIELLRESAPPGVNVDALGLRDATRAESLGLGLRVGADTEPALMMKGCVALMAPAGKEFLLGDNPFVNLSSQEHFYMRGAVFSPVTYFWFPLNPKVGLFFAKDVGVPILEGSIKTAHASSRLTDLLNRAEIFVATDHIAGSKKGMIRTKVRLSNVGSERNSVERFGLSPIVINQNNCVYRITEDLVDEVRNQVG
jgi:hypothetical protein